MLVKRYLGLKTSVYCDRCLIDISKDFYVLCKDCFHQDPTTIRLHKVRLPYQAKIEGMTCALCKSKKKQYELNHVCHSCLSQHDDNTHSGWYINSEYTNNTILYRHCICGDVVRITTGENDVFEYFKVGRKMATLNSYKCNRNPYRDGEECVHDWIVLGSDVSEESYDSYQGLLALKENPGLKIMGLDEIGLENLAFGSTKSWCCKCGCFYDLSFLKERLLPEQGYIK
ncbi:hypothetical protein [Paenibacillus chitinolyticus]|uniref:hypothetical protein n=1 Tax=Paenibacillus chitinolyticus TaxID=79263 RepID=UPI00366EA0E9